MFQLRKQTSAEPYTASLTLSVAEATLQRTFSSEIVTGFRQMATELSYAGSLPQRIAVVSALQGEGVTYTALALGAVLANDTSTQICVVDLNWWRPGIVACLDPAFQTAPTRRKKKTKPMPSEAAQALAARPGTGQLAAGTAVLDEVLVTTHLPNLSLILAGECPLERRPALARSATLRAAINELSARFDHIIFDVPAVLSTSDAIALASLSDAACVVVRHGVTATSSVQLALDAIKHMPILGVVLNQVTIKTPRWIRAMIPQE